MNPLDQQYTSTSLQPKQHRLNVFFDRQDSGLLGIDDKGADDSRMANFTEQTDPNASVLDPTNNAYFLKTSLGYYVNFPSAGSTFTTKGITPPLLLGGTAFFSAFRPMAADPCSGGAGETDTFRLCSVMRPVMTTKDASKGPDVAGCKSGRVLKFSGVASRIAARSPVAVMQTGVDPVRTDGGSESGTGLQIESILGPAENRFIRPRVWRSVR
jgi:hypothetical protein